MSRLISEHTFVMAASRVASNVRGSKPQPGFLELQLLFDVSTIEIRVSFLEFRVSCLENRISRLQFCILVLRFLVLREQYRSLRLEFRMFLLERSNISVPQLNLVSPLLFRLFEDEANMGQDVVKCPVDITLLNEA
jgi:hypothetical protein